MNIFTNDDYRRIQAWLKANAIKDSDFPLITELVGEETITILSQGENKRFPLKKLEKLAKNAYELAVEQGFKGSLDEWLDSLKGDNYVLEFDINDGMHLKMATIEETQVNFKVNDESHLVINSNVFNY